MFDAVGHSRPSTVRQTSGRERQAVGLRVVDVVAQLTRIRDRRADANAIGKVGMRDEVRSGVV